MSKMITWHQYFTLIGSLTLLYYVLILWLYYKTEILAAFAPKTQTASPITSPGNIQQQPLMGEPEFDGQQTVGAEDIFFAAPDEEENEQETPTTEATKQPDIPTMPDETFLLGPVADFLKELKSSFSLLKEAQGDKEEFLTLLGILSEKYNTVMQSAYRPLLEVFILELATEQLPFELTPADLQIPSSIQQ
jgi:hypothetical protein